jgi:hypothetical protein
MGKIKVTLRKLYGLDCALLKVAISANFSVKALILKKKFISGTQRVLWNSS